MGKNGIRLISVGLLVFWGFAGSALGDGCGDSLQEIAHFEKELKQEIPRCLVPTRLSAALHQQLANSPILSADEKSALASGLDPLLLSPAVISAWQEAYTKFIEQSALKAPKKASLIEKLERAANDLRGRAAPLQPVGGKEVGGEPSGGSASPTSFMKLVQAKLASHAFRTCLNRTARLFVVSNLINTGGALMAHWEDYAGERRGYILNLLGTKVWQRALSDGRFIHNVTWNALLMAGLAGFSCMANQTEGHWLLTGVGLTASLIGQGLFGNFSLRQVGVDTLFVHFISYYKARGAVWLAETYEGKGLPHPRLVETVIYTINEGIGAIGYPLVDDFSRYVCDDPAPKL